MIRTILGNMIRQELEPIGLKYRFGTVKILENLKERSVPLRKPPLRKALIRDTTQKTNQLLVDAEIAIKSIRPKKNIPMPPDWNRIIDDLADHRCTLHANLIQPLQSTSSRVLRIRHRRSLRRISVHCCLHRTNHHRRNAR